MNPHSRLKLEPLPLAVEEQIDQICLRFEEEWQTRRPALRPYLEEVAPAWQSALFRELLWIDFEYLGGRGERPELGKYVETCADQPELRAVVESLLAAHEASGSNFPDRAATPQPNRSGEDTPESQGESPSRPPLHGATDEHPLSAPGTVIAGRYVLVERIGQGGMGEVWIANQTEPVKRPVALKLIKAGMDSRTVLTRFEAERQALALMDHPHIARVHDGGIIGADAPGLAGRPFFVMELVNGLSLTRFCDEARLTPRERLELFVPICQAVQHAHQKGIVHRDLKPSNILVTRVDGRPIPKVIDFGVAKAIGGKLTDDSFATQFGVVLGTLEYMAPEQAGFSGIDVDTRADIYSLGVILYELLTGLRPLDAKRLKQASGTEMLRRIREEEPLKPSTRLSTDESLPSLAALRQTEPKRLMALLRGELDWVVMKCLEKDRGRRYETADGLVRDIQRYLADEPVEARPPSASYRLGKFLRRHRGPVLAATVVVLALVGGVIGTTWGMVRAEQQRVLAEAAAAQERLAREGETEQARLAEQRKQQAEDNEKKAVREKQIAEAVRTFLQRSLLRQADATAQANALLQLDGLFRPKENPTIKELLDRAAAELAPGKIEAKFPGEKEVQASILQTVGDTYWGIGEYGKAVEFLTRASDLYCAALGADHEHTLAARTNLAVAYWSARRLPQTIELLEQVRGEWVRTLGADHPHALATLNALGIAYASAGKLPQAVELLEQVRDVRARTLGIDHPSTLTTLNNLALAYAGAGKLPQAIGVLEQVRDTLMKKVGPDHPSTHTAMNNLAFAYWTAGRLPEAIELFQTARDGEIKTLGPEHPETLTTHATLAQAYVSAGRPEQALPLFRQAAEGIEKRKFQHPHAGRIIADLSNCHEHLQHYAEAEPWRRKWLAVLKEQGGADAPACAPALAALGLNLLKQQKWTEAEPVLREALAIHEKMTPSVWTAFHVQSLLGGALVGQQKYTDAEPLLLAGYEGMKKRQAEIPADDRSRLGEALERLVRLYDAWGKKDQAAPLRKRLEEVKAAAGAPQKK